MLLVAQGEGDVKQVKTCCGLCGSKPSNEIVPHDPRSDQVIIGLNALLFVTYIYSALKAALIHPMLLKAFAESHRRYNARAPDVAVESMPIAAGPQTGLSGALTPGRTQSEAKESRRRMSSADPSSESGPEESFSWEGFLFALKLGLIYSTVGGLLLTGVWISVGNSRHTLLLLIGYAMALQTILGILKSGGLFQQYMIHEAVDTPGLKAFQYFESCLTVIYLLMGLWTVYVGHRCGAPKPEL